MGIETCEIDINNIETGNDLVSSVRNNLLALEVPDDIESFDFLKTYLQSNNELHSQYVENYGDEFEMVAVFDFFLRKYNLYTNFGNRSFQPESQKAALFGEVIGSDLVSASDYALDEIFPDFIDHTSNHEIFFLNTPGILFQGENRIFSEDEGFFSGTQVIGSYIFVNLYYIKEGHKKVHGDDAECNFYDTSIDGVIADELTHHILTTPYKGTISDINWNSYGSENIDEIIQFLSEFSNYYNNSHRLKEWILKSLDSISIKDGTVTSNSYGVYAFTHNLALNGISETFIRKGLNLGEFIQDEVDSGNTTIAGVTDAIIGVLDQEDMEYIDTSLRAFHARMINEISN